VAFFTKCFLLCTAYSTLVCSVCLSCWCTAIC